jgi:DNA-binding NarL/FixJ family response regulator
MAQSSNATKHRILIVARPGPLRDSLAALLSALPQVGQILQAGDDTAVLHFVAANRPQLVIADIDWFSDGLLPWLTALRDQLPGSKCLVLVEDVDQKQSVERSNGDAALVKGAPPAEIILLVERLLAAPTD